MVFVVTCGVGISNFLWLPLSGALSDRIGRRPLLYVIPVLAVLTSYPAMTWLVAAPSIGRLLAVELLLSFFFGVYNGAMVPLLVEIMPARVRTAGLSLAYSLATAGVGRVTHALSSHLLEATGNNEAPALCVRARAP